MTLARKAFKLLQAACCIGLSVQVCQADTKLAALDAKPNMVVAAPQWTYGLQLQPVAGPWYVIPGANDDFSIKNGCNIINTVVYRSDSELVVINSGPSKRYGDQQRLLVEGALGKAVKDVIALNLHPDYFFGHQAYANASTWATQTTIEGAVREGGAYADNLYRLCGDWMKGTESTPPKKVLNPASPFLKDTGLQWLALSGHTDSDLAIFDEKTGVLVAGGLVFHDRVLTTPHANIPPWIKSLQVLKALKPKIVIPSHGPLSRGDVAIDQTLDYLNWLDALFSSSAKAGKESVDVMNTPIPERFKSWAAMPAEFVRNVTHLYPSYEEKSLGR